MEIRNLITFTKVAETQSLSKAAKALGYAQSTVTMQMQQLEQELGGQLYERVGKQIRITQTGQEFLSYASAIVRMSEEALMVGKPNTSAVTGSLRLGILSPISGKALSSCVAQYLQSYPQVDLNVQTMRDSEDLLSQLRHNNIDLALTLDARRTDDDLIHAAEDQPAALHLYTGKDHPLAGRHSLSAELISQYPLIRTGYFETGHDICRCPGSRQIQISDLDLALSVVGSQTVSAPQNDSGVQSPEYMILAPDLVIQNHLAASKLIRLDYEFSGSSLWVQVLYHRNKWLTGAMKAWLLSSQKHSSFL